MCLVGEAACFDSLTMQSGQEYFIRGWHKHKVETIYKYKPINIEYYTTAYAVRSIIKIMRQKSVESRPDVVGSKRTAKSPN